VLGQPSAEEGGKKLGNNQETKREGNRTLVPRGAVEKFARQHGGHEGPRLEIVKNRKEPQVPLEVWRFLDIKKIQ